jgi:hypothetical protein
MPDLIRHPPFRLADSSAMFRALDPESSPDDGVGAVSLPSARSPFVLSLSKHRPSLLPAGIEEGRHFDRLSASGGKYLERTNHKQMLDSVPLIG